MEFHLSKKERDEFIFTLRIVEVIHFNFKIIYFADILNYQFIKLIINFGKVLYESFKLHFFYDHQLVKHSFIILIALLFFFYLFQVKKLNLIHFRYC